MSQPDFATLRCQVCGRGPARNLVIRRHVGMLVMQRFVKLRAALCREHGVALTKKYLGKTLLEGWWGYISFFVNWFVVVTDLVALSQAKKLPQPDVQPDPASQQAQAAAGPATPAADAATG
ncbi:MAG: hypothetical protein QOD07_2370 [Frankiaceae bacterium]|jgi:hypothetical protein|nr:hypothetical protein [Frankiaceae bacterium]